MFTPVAGIGDDLAHLVQIGAAQQAFDRTDRRGPHRQVAQSNRRKAQRLHGATRILATERQRRLGVGAPLHDGFQKRQVTDVERVITAAHPLVFTVGGKEELLEIVPGEETLAEVLAFMADYGERVLGKGIVWAKDTPNFVGNRIGVQGMGKAMQIMLEDGISIPEVDALFGPALGRPKTAMFKTSDLVGLDTMGHVARNSFELVTDEEEKKDFVIPEFVNQMIEKKLLGKKTQAGFYKTDLTPEWKKVRKVINPETLEYEDWQKVDFPCLAEAKKAKTLAEKIRTVVYGDDKGARFAWKVVANGMIYAANRIPEISDTVVEIDNAMKWGYNFEMGPFETWDAIGVQESVAKMETDGLTVPAKVKDMLAAGVTSFYKTENGKVSFYDFDTKGYKEVVVSESNISLAALKGSGKLVKTCDSASLVDLGDGVFCCEFHT